MKKQLVMALLAAGALAGMSGCSEGDSATINIDAPTTTNNNSGGGDGGGNGGGNGGGSTAIINCGSSGANCDAGNGTLLLVAAGGGGAGFPLLVPFLGRFCITVEPCLSKLL